MPSKSASQARLMAAVAHGWHPTQFKGPSKAVAQEFNQADEGKHAPSRLAEHVNNLKKKRKLVSSHRRRKG